MSSRAIPAPAPGGQSDKKLADKKLADKKLADKKLADKKPATLNTRKGLVKT